MDAFGNIISYLNDTRFLDISLMQYSLAFLAILLSLILRRVFTSVVIGQLRKIAERTRTDLDELLLEAIAPPLAFAFVIGGLWIAAVVLVLPHEPVDVHRVAFMILRTLIIVDITWALFRVTDVFATAIGRFTAKTDSSLDDQLVPIIRKSIKVFVGVLAFVFAVQNLGYSVASLLAGLGIGGLAVAFAAKDTIANFFGSITILLDRPFTVGDWIETPDYEGVVEEVGFRSTKVRTFARTQVSVPNSILANDVVNNWSRMPIRRIKMVVGVTYESTAEQMEQAVEGIRKLLGEHEGVHKDFYLVYFTDFGSSSLDIFVYYFSETTVWAEYLAVRQDVNLKIMRLLESLDMEVAFPSRTVYLRNEDGSSPPSAGRQA